MLDIPISVFSTQSASFYPESMYGTPIVLIVCISKRWIFNAYVHVFLEGQQAEQEDSVLSHSLAV